MFFQGKGRPDMETVEGREFEIKAKLAQYILLLDNTYTTLVDRVRELTNYDISQVVSTMQVLKKDMLTIETTESTASPEYKMAKENYLYAVKIYDDALENVQALITAKNPTTSLEIEMKSEILNLERSRNGYEKLIDQLQKEQEQQNTFSRSPKI